MKTKAAIIVAPRRIELVDETLPPMGNDDVLIKMISVGLCHSDLPEFLGTASTERGGHYARLSEPVFPMHVGHEPVGCVLDAGSGVTCFKPGDIVTGLGGPGFSEYLVLPQNVPLCVVPPQAENYKHCLGEPMGCIVNIVQTATPRLGETVAVIGCGFMGLMAIAGLKGSGAKEIVAVDVQPGRLELAKKYGATKLLNPAECDVEQEAFAMTGGKFFDIVVEITGSLKGLETASSIVKFCHDDYDVSGKYQGRGRILISSVYGKNEAFSPKLAYNLMYRTPDLLSAHPNYAIDPVANIREGVDAYISGRLPLSEMVTHEIPFDEVQKGFEILENAPEGYIKGIVYM